MLTTEVYGDTYDFFADSHYIHSFRGVAYDYSDDEPNEHPRTVRFPIAGPRSCGLTG